MGHEFLLKLVMIVKNEARGIGKTLASVKPWIDSWSILDTGSTDGTQDVIRSELAEVPGTLHEAPFVDFSTSRNHSMRLAGNDCTYLMNLDAEDILIGGAALRSFLRAERESDGAPAFYLMHREGRTYRRVHIVRSDAGWWYSGVVHEILGGPGRPKKVPDVHLEHEKEPESAERSARRWKRDVELLSAEVQANPRDDRSWFYLGQSHFALGNYGDAMRAYRRRIELSGWNEEVFYSKWCLARIAEIRGDPWPDVQQLHLEAFAQAPHRAEPLAAIASHYVRIDQPALAYVFAARAYEIPFPPEDCLFVDTGLYEWRAADLLGTAAFYVGAFAVGEEAARKALAKRPDLERLQTNLRFYLRRKGRDGAS